MTHFAPPLAILSACLLAACAPPIPECPTTDELGLQTGDLLEEPDASEPDFPAFALGVEYLQLGLAEPYAEAGARWGKTRLEAFAWDVVEPEAPRGGEHTYDWRCPDAQVAEWQQAGVTRLQSYLQPRSRWGSRGAERDLRPKVAREQDYRDWVRALVERYDGDGTDDMPGLVRPVRHWVVGGEWSGFWPLDDADAYLHVLEMTREEALAASDEALLGTVPFLLIDLFEGNEPDDEAVASRLAAGTPDHRNSTEGMLAILDRDDLFDYVDVHSLGDYTELPPTARWLRAEMAERGYDKPIWIDDAFSISFLANRWWPAWYPVTEARREATFEALYSVASMDSDEAEAWIRAECAKGLVHKAVTALGEGYAGIQLGNTEDWMSPNSTALRQETVAFIGAAAMMGMVDVESTGSFAQVRTPGAARPALHTLELLTGQLGDGDFDVVAPLGGLTGVRGYRLERDGAPKWVLWAEDGVLQLPGEEESPTPLSLTVPDGVERVTVTAAVTAVGASEPEVTDAYPVDGVVALDLTSVPVFIEPAPLDGGGR